MSMSNKGLTKVIEECGELIQVCAKKINYMHTDDHPDGTNLRIRMFEEIADVMATLDFMMDKFKVTESELKSITYRAKHKVALFNQWDKE